MTSAAGQGCSCLESLILNVACRTPPSEKELPGKHKRNVTSRLHLNRLPRPPKSNVEERTKKCVHQPRPCQHWNWGHGGFHIRMLRGSFISLGGGGACSSVLCCRCFFLSAAGAAASLLVMPACVFCRCVLVRRSRVSLCRCPPWTVYSTGIHCIPFCIPLQKTSIPCTP